MFLERGLNIERWTLCIEHWTVDIEHGEINNIQQWTHYGMTLWDGLPLIPECLNDNLGWAGSDNLGGAAIELGMGCQ
eukprot:6482380-Amphidinium_carterae.1